MKKKFLTLDDRQIAYLENDTEGPTIVFIHGNSQSSETFSSQFSGKLDSKFHLLALDLLGHGDSSKAEDYSLPIHGETLKNFSKGLGLQDALFVGHSMGGHILLEVLEDLPASGAMIFGTPPVANPPAMDMAFLAEPAGALLYKNDLSDEELNTLLDAFTETGKGREIIKESILKSDPETRAKLGASVGALNFKDEILVIATTETPLAVIHGEKDKFINADYISALPFSNLWKNRVFEMKGIGHFPQMEDPIQFNETLFYFAWYVFNETQKETYLDNTDRISALSEVGLN